MLPNRVFASEKPTLFGWAKHAPKHNNIRAKNDVLR